MFATGPNSFYPALLVGITEAGFLPGILLYLTYWFPAFSAPAPTRVYDRDAGDHRAGVDRLRLYPIDGRPEPARLAVLFLLEGSRRCCSVLWSGSER